MSGLDAGVGWLLLLAAIGMGAGSLAGLLGIGGGIVVVPALYYALALTDTEPGLRMHVAVGTSLASMVLTSIRSTLAHHRRDAVDLALLHRWAPAAAAGVVVGAVIAARVSDRPLLAIFALVASLVALQLAFAPELARPVSRSPSVLAGRLIAATIGLLSALMGIGGGSMTVPVLHFYGYAIHRAIGTAAALGLAIALPGALGFMLGGWDRAGLPAGSLGYVYLPGLALIVPGGWFGVPLGVKLAHALPARRLRQVFALFLLVTALRMGAELFQA